MYECLYPNSSEILLLYSEMLGPHVEYCTYRSTLTIKRTKKEHGSCKNGPEDWGEELELLSSGNEYNALPHECKRRGRGKAVLCPLGGDKVFMIFVQRGFLKIGGSFGKQGQTLA